MAEWLLLRLPRSADQAATWMVADGAGRVVAPPQAGALVQAASLAPGRRICAIVPGTDVLLTDAELPAKASGAKLLQVVPYALEEHVADDIENLHFAVGRRSPASSRIPVAVVSRELLEEWLSELRNAGLSPEAMYADSELVPANPAQAVAVIDEDAIIVRPVGGMPVTLPADALETAFELACAGGGDAEQSPKRPLVLYVGPAEWQRHSREVEALRERFDGIKVQLLTSGPLALYAQQLPHANPINLLQGAYAPKTAYAMGWRAWRTAAVLLVCLIGLHLAGKAAELAILKRTERQLDASLTEAIAAVMPGEPVTPDIRRRMEQQLLAARESEHARGLLAVLGALAQARQGVPGSVVKALSYREGTLEARITAPDADALERISQQLRTNGWQADLTSGTVVDGGYEGRVRIQGGGA
ncbi:MAG: type II secretion system protein GspL [Pseudomonadota bacterium]|jgi:Type II secretory pathway, component PulL|nr:MAG: hypothetical protein DIU56_04500 [Pseudomonadota bacterium]